MSEEEFIKGLINCVVSNSEVTKAGGILIKSNCNEEIKYNLDRYIKAKEQVK